MESFVKYIKIKQLGDEENTGIFDSPNDEIVIQEKVDGANMSMRFIDGEVVFGSRNRFLIGGLETGKPWAEGIAFLKECMGEKTLNSDYIYFMERMTKHSLNYNWDTIPKVLGYDILYIGADEPAYLGYEHICREYKRLGIPMVPLQYNGKIKDIDVTKIESFIKKSAYADTDQEGIVIKNYNRVNSFGRQLFAKIVTADFKEKNKVAFKAFKHVDENTPQIVDEFITPARIRKILNKLVVDESVPLSRKLMHTLPRAVILDVLEEEYKSIFDKYKYIDFKKMKQLVAKKCLRAIDDAMLEKAGVK